MHLYCSPGIAAYCLKLCAQLICVLGIGSLRPGRDTTPWHAWSTGQAQELLNVLLWLWLRLLCAVKGHPRQQHKLVVAAAAGTEPSSKKQKPNQVQPKPSGSRNARLYEMFDDDGWGVEAVPAAAAPKQTPTSAPPQRKAQQQQQQQQTAGEPTVAALKPCVACLGCRFCCLCDTQSLC